MSKTIQLLFILLFIHCFISKRILAGIIISDISAPNEKVIQSAIYHDDTILLRLVNVTTNGCYGNQVNLKLIQRDGTIKSLIINNDAIIGQNFCIPPTNQEFEGDIPLDGIRIYSLNPHYILLTYFCTIEQNTTCGQLIDWDNENLNEFNFGQKCDNSSIVVQDLIYGGEFLRVCYLSQQSQVNWTRYTIDKNNRTINAQDSGFITNVGPFSQLSKHLFPTAGGGYGIVTKQSIDPPGTNPALYVNFIPPLSYLDMNGPFQLYTSDTPNLTSYNVYKCGISYAGLGYNCIIRLVNTTVNINFLDSGSILNTNGVSLSNLNVNVIRVDLLYYGGFVILANSTTGVVSGTVYNNNGFVYGDWGMPLTNTYTGIFGVFTNNTIWSIGNSAQGVQQLITNDLFVNYSSGVSQDSVTRIKNLGNPFIEWVTIGNGNNNYTNINGTISIPTTINPSYISIKYVNLIELSNGNFSIWQSWDNNQMTLRQSFSGNQSQFIQVNNDMIVTITLFESTFNIPGAQYYIKLDPGFVKDLRTGQDLIGVGKNRWAFMTETDVQDTGTGSTSALIRLTPEGTRNFASLKNQETFINSMTQELIKLIPIDSSRLSTRKHYQYDSSAPEDQIIFRIDIKVANDGDLLGMANSWRVVKDLNTLIRNKNFTGIGRGEFSNMLDDTFGSERTQGLWRNYWWTLVIVGTAILLLFILFCLARRCCRGGVNKGRGRNYVIFIFAIIIIDFGLDIAFVALHGHDLKWLYPTSVVFLTVPILINTIATFIIITKETGSDNNEFADWWRHNSKTALFFTLFSIIDIEGLTIMSSGYSGYDRFNAPISDGSFKGVIFTSALVKILEDVPQLTIYSLYQVRTVVPAIIPILALSSCCFVIAIKTAIVIGFCIYRRPPRSYYSIRKGKIEEFKNTSPEYKPKTPSPPPGTPKQPFADASSKETTPDSTIAHSTGNGVKLGFRTNEKADIMDNLHIKVVGTPVSQSIVNEGRTGEERLSDQGIMGTTLVEDNGDKPRESIEAVETGSIEALDPGDPGGGSVIQGPSSGYQSRLIEKIEIDPEEQPPQQEREQQEPSSSQSSSSLGSFVRSLGRRKDSQKGKAREYDDKSKKGKKDDG